MQRTHGLESLVNEVRSEFNNLTYHLNTDSLDLYPALNKSLKLLESGKHPQSIEAHIGKFFLPQLEKLANDSLVHGLITYNRRISTQYNLIEKASRTESVSDDMLFKTIVDNVYIAYSVALTYLKDIADSDQGRRLTDKKYVTEPPLMRYKKALESLTRVYDHIAKHVEVSHRDQERFYFMMHMHHDYIDGVMGLHKLNMHNSYYQLHSEIIKPTS